MILPNGATVAVADGEKLRLFRNKGHEPHIVLTALPDPDVKTANRGSGARHTSAAANPDQDRLREDDFAAAAADFLNRQVLGGEIENLFVIADPRTLGEMRRHFHDALKGRLAGSLAKDLTGHDPDAIAAAIARA